MNGESRVKIKDRLFRIDSFFEELIADDNPDVRIRYSCFTQEGNYYVASINPATGAARENLSDVQDKDWVSVKIPINIMDEGYAEGSSIAARFNTSQSAFCNIELVDRELLKLIDAEPIVIRQPQLPIVMVHEDKFFLDVDYMEIRKVDDPEVCRPIRMLDRLPTGGYVFDFDISTHDFPRWDYAEKNIKQCFIDELVKVDPKGMARRYGIDVKDLPERDHELRSNQELVDSRIIYGRLPVFRILNRDYYVDLRMNEMRNTENPFSTIALQDWFFWKQLTTRFFFDCKKHQKVNIPWDQKEIPSNVVQVLLPSPQLLDPVGNARLERENVNASLAATFPLGKIEARVFPLTDLKRFKRIEMEQMENKKRLAEKKGKGRQQGL